MIASRRRSLAAAANWKATTIASSTKQPRMVMGSIRPMTCSVAGGSESVRILPATSHGATSIGLTEHVGVLRGLIEGRVRLGPWKDRLLREPLRITEAYLAGAQAAA